MRDLSLVTASCRVEGEPGWGLGVMGSTRMEYAHVVALVEHVARSVSEILRGLKT
jgi:heat-inducible transcriptional repressor